MKTTIIMVILIFYLMAAYVLSGGPVRNPKPRIVGKSAKTYIDVQVIKKKPKPKHYLPKIYYKH